MKNIPNTVKIVILALSVSFLSAQSNCNIDQEIKSMLDGAFARTQSQTAKIYVSSVSFLDKDTGSTFGTPTAELINKAVRDGMATMASTDPAKYAANAPQHSIADTDANANKLASIFWDQNLTKDQKLEKIIKDVMEINGVDVLMAGQYVQRDDKTVNLRPFIVSRANKSMVSENFNYNVGEFLCTDPANQSVKTLCPKAHDDVRDAVVRLLRQL